MSDGHRELSTWRSTSRTIRDEFPILRREIDGAPIVYLDSANTSQKPQSGDRRDDDVPSRRRTRRSTAAPTASPPRPPTPTRRPASRSPASSTRRSADEVVFTKNATEALNLVAQSWGGANLQRRRRRACSPQMEHHANIVPWHMLARPSAASSCAGSRSPPTASSTSPTSTACSTAPRCSSFTAMSNVLGTLTPVAELCARRPRRRRAGDRRRLPVRAAQRHRRAGVGRRLRRLLQPQDVRPVGHRRCCGAARNCSTRCRRSSAAAT